MVEALGEFPFFSHCSSSREDSMSNNSLVVRVSFGMASIMRQSSLRVILPEIVRAYAGINSHISSCSSVSFPIGFGSKSNLLSTVLIFHLPVGSVTHRY